MPDKTLERKRKAQRALDRKRRDLRAARDQMEHEAKVADDWLRFVAIRFPSGDRGTTT